VVLDLRTLKTVDTSFENKNVGPSITALHTADGMIATASRFKIQLWSLDPLSFIHNVGEEIEEELSTTYWVGLRRLHMRPAVVPKHDDNITCMLFTPRAIVSGSFDKTIKVWDYSKEPETGTLFLRDRIHEL